MKESTRENKHRIEDDVQKFDLICQKYSDFFYDAILTYER